MIKKLLSKQQGLVMPTVIILFAVIIILSFSALSISLNQTSMNKRYVGSVNAIHLAEAGVNEYMWHLNKIQSDPIPENENISFSDGYFRVELIEVEGESVETGRVTVKVTGINGDEHSSLRTIQAVLSKRSFTEYIYLSDSDGTGINAVWNVCIHEWHGPYHTNGILNISGSPTFHGRVTYSTPYTVSNPIREDNWYDLVNPIYLSGEPIQINEVVFPSTNNEIRDRALDGGHYYEGMTAIFLKGDKYDVRTFDSDAGVWKYNNKSYTGNNSDLNLSYPTGANAKPPLEDAPSLDLPDNGVIYVDGAGGSKWRRKTGDLYISGELNGSLTIASANNTYITGFDPTDWSQPDSADGNPKRVPQGSLTGGLKYSSGTENTSVLGLIAQNNIEILNLYWPGHTQTGDNDNRNHRWDLGNNDVERDVAIENLRLDGVYFALGGSVKYDQVGVDKGIITMFGSMIQKNRGAFGVGQIGYGRNFTYDQKLQYQTPPYFLDPVNSGWEIIEWREVNDHVE